MISVARKRLGWGVFAVLVLAIGSGILMARHVWNEALQQHGIKALEWQGLDVSLDGVSVGKLTLIQMQSMRKIVLHASGLELEWLLPEWGQGWRPQLTILTVAHLSLDWIQKPEKSLPVPPPQSNKWPPELPGWLPSELILQSFQATFPCETGRCPLTGSLSVFSSQPGPATTTSSTSLRTRMPIKTVVQLEHGGHRVSASATLDNSGTEGLIFSTELAIDGTRYLSVNSGYKLQNTNDLVSWYGSVEMPDLPQTDWLLAWLKTWQDTSLEQWPAQPEAGSVKANWQLQGPKGESFLAQATGRVNIQARVPQPWPAPGIGQISGNIEVNLEANKGQWQPENLTADLKLNHPAAWIKKIPQLMRPKSLTLSVRPGMAITPSPGSPMAPRGTEQTLLPLKVTLDSHGGADISMRSHLAVTTQAPWMMQLGKTQLGAALPELKVAGWLMIKPKIQMTMTGWLNTSNAALKLGQPTVLHMEKLEPLSGSAMAVGQEMFLKGLQANLSGMKLRASYGLMEGKLNEFTLNGPVSLKARQIKHPQLITQPWQLNSTVNSNLAHTDITGVLRADTGTTVNFDLNFPYQELLTIKGKMRANGEQEANALSRIFTAWPPLLTVSGGNISASATYKQPQNEAARLTGKLVFADWSGTYDRTAWSKMNGSAELLLKNDRISITMPELTIKEVNPGLPVGPVVVAGGYEASLKQLTEGALTLEQASSGALGGEVEIQPGSWNLAQTPVTIPVKLNQLSLARLLQLYPAEGLTGTGILSGTVPLLFDPATGIRVKQGRIDALEPGGRLQVTAERLKMLASQSESMKLVAQALENFRYSVLESDINYSEEGTLMLKLHLEGSSPEVGKGQPVNLNVNLEENIPALLTSLQLSGRVSDAVTERVKKMLRKREHNPDDLLE